MNNLYFSQRLPHHVSFIPLALNTTYPLRNVAILYNSIISIIFSINVLCSDPPYFYIFLSMELTHRRCKFTIYIILLCEVSYLYEYIRIGFPIKCRGERAVDASQSHLSSDPVVFTFNWNLEVAKTNRDSSPGLESGELFLFFTGLFILKYFIPRTCPLN